MKLFEYIDKELFLEMVALDYIKVVEHPSGNGYRVINYTKECQAAQMWNDTTIKCRGIIVDDNDNIIARPFQKFFNYEEYTNPNDIKSTSSFKVYEKLDGTLGILYWIDNTPYIATKGSFDGPQAVHATNILHTKYKDIYHTLNRNYTYLFEIIYPKDTHCVKYGGVDDIFLLAILHTEYETLELDPNILNETFNVVKQYDGVEDWKTIREIFDGYNREGFVIKFDNNFRLKLKYEEYKRLYFLKTGFTEKHIIELIRNDEYDVIEETLTLFDEEQLPYYISIIDNVKNTYKEIETISLNEYRDDFETDKDAALYFKTCTYPHILFYKRKGYDYKQLIWKYTINKLKK